LVYAYGVWVQLQGYVYLCKVDTHLSTYGVDCGLRVSVS